MRVCTVTLAGTRIRRCGTYLSTFTFCLLRIPSSAILSKNSSGTLKFCRSGEEDLWEQQLATSLFRDFACLPFSEVTPSASSLSAASLHANVNASLRYPMSLVLPRDRQLAKASAYAPSPS